MILVGTTNRKYVPDRTSWGSGSVSISTDLPFIADVYAAVRLSVLDMLFVSAVKTGKLTITHISGNSAAPTYPWSWSAGWSPAHRERDEEKQSAYALTMPLSETRIRKL